MRDVTDDLTPHAAEAYGFISGNLFDAGGTPTPHTIVCEALDAHARLLG